MAIIKLNRALVLDGYGLHPVGAELPVTEKELKGLLAIHGSDIAVIKSGKTPEPAIEEVELQGSTDPVETSAGAGVDAETAESLVPNPPDLKPDLPVPAPDLWPKAGKK